MSNKKRSNDDEKFSNSTKTFVQEKEDDFDDILKKLEQMTLKAQEVLKTSKKGINDIFNELCLFIKKENTDPNIIQLYLDMLELMKIKDKEAKRIKLEDITDLCINELNETDPEAILLYEPHDSDSESEIDSEDSKSESDLEDSNLCKRCLYSAGSENNFCKCSCHSQYKDATDKMDEDEDEDEEIICDNGYETDEDWCSDCGSNCDCIKDDDKCIDCDQYLDNCECEKPESEEDIFKAVLDDIFENEVDFHEYKTEDDKKEIKQEMEEELRQEEKEDEEDQINTFYHMICENLQILQEHEVNYKNLFENDMDLISSKELVSKLKETTPYEEMEEIYEICEENIEKFEKFFRKEKKQIQKICRTFKLKMENFFDLIEYNSEIFNNIHQYSTITSPIEDFMASIEDFLNDEYNDENFKIFYSVEKLEKELIKHESNFEKVINSFNEKQTKIYNQWKEEYCEKDHLTLELIREEQQDESLILPKENINLLIQEIAQDYNTNIKFTENAFEAIQTAAEEFLIEHFSKANKAAIHRKSSIVDFKDAELKK